MVSARRWLTAAILLAACNEPTRAVLRDAGADVASVRDAGPGDPRVGAAQPGDCAAAHGGCSAYATCEPAGSGLRRCVCAPGLRVRDDQRGCEGLLLASVDRDGRAGAGPTLDPQLAADGRFVTFVSSVPRLATDVLPPALDAPATPQCYVRDLRTGRTAVVSADSEGGYASGGACVSPQLVADGSRVAFLYADAALTLRAPRGRGLQVYSRALGASAQAGALTWHATDVNRPGVNGGAIGGLRINRSGSRFVVATDGRLATNDDDTQTDLYLLEVTTGAVRRLTQRADGSVAPWVPCAGGNVGGWWWFSRDGNLATLNSARNFVGADLDAVRDPYLVRVDPPLVLLLASPRRQLADGDCHVLELGTVVSGDGRWALFQSDNPRFDASLQYNEPDYYLRDLSAASGAASVRALHLRPGLADQPALSGDGSVAMITGLTRVDPDGDGQRGVTPHLYRVTLTSDPVAIELVDRTADGRVLDTERGRFVPSLSDDARAVAFVTSARLLPEDENDTSDVYVRVWW